MKSTLAFTCLVIVVAGSFLGAQQEPPTGKPGMTGMTNQPQRTDRDTDPNMIQKFAKHSYLCNLMEIELGKIVQAKADRNDVKEFARWMVDAHTKANQDLKSAAATQGITLPMELEAWQKAKLDHVRTIDARDLSGLYIFGQVGAHHMALLGNRCAVNKLQDGEFKKLAQKMVTEVRHHLEQAEKISESIVAGRREEVAASSHMRGLNDPADNE